MSGFASNINMNNRGSALNITALVCAESGTYDDQYIRPFEPKLDERSFQLMKNTTDNFTKLNPNALLQSAGMFLKPKAQPESIAGIDNGWGTRRLKFHMTVESGGMHSRIIEIISGYTDHADLSLESGLIAPDTRFYITNVARARSIEGSFGPGGMLGTKVSLSSNHQVLRNSRVGSGMSFQNTVTMTPKDVFAYGQSKQTIAAMGAMDEFATDDDVVLMDMRTTFNPAEPIKLTKRSNTVQNNYVSTLLGSYRDAAESADFTTDSDVFELASDNTGDIDVMSIDSLATFNTKTQFNEGGFFTFAELEYLCPHLDKVLHVGRRSNQQVIPNERHQTQGFHSSGPETLVANILAQTVSSLATDHLFAFVHFTVSNDTVNGEVQFEYNHDNSYLPSYLSPAVGKDAAMADNLLTLFENEVKRVVMYHATNGGNNVVTAMVRFDFFGDTYIVVDVNHSGRYEYIAPTYCDGLFSPMLTADQTSLEVLSSDVETIFSMDSDTHFDSSMDPKPFAGLATGKKQWSF